MGLEAATYLLQLDANNPLAGDKKNQGDDHLRLLKNVLKNTFPNATKEFYLPGVSSTKVASYNAVASDQNQTIICDASVGGFAINLPGGMNSGWEVSVMKSDSGGGNQIFVVPPTGTIASFGGAFVAQVRVCVPFLIHTFRWLGGIFIHTVAATRPGVIEWFPGALPIGFALADGRSLLRTDFPELFSWWGTTFGAADGTHFSAPDLRDRFVVGSGASYATGATGGENTHTLLTAELPTGKGGLTATVNDSRTWATTDALWGSGNFGGRTAGTEFSNGPSTRTVTPSGTISADVTGDLGSGHAHENRPPYFGLLPIFRLC